MINEQNIQKQPILVTGAHRSGTTWVGKTLAFSREVCYVHEPFNINMNPGLCSADFKYWFRYIDHTNENEFYPYINDMLDFKYNMGFDFKSKLKLSRYGSTFKTPLKFYRAKLKNQRMLIKDPIAIFSAPWLYENFNFQIVVMIRHPAAFTSSLIRLGFNHPFHHFLEQPNLFETFDPVEQKQIELFANEKKEGIEQACLLWNLIYQRIKLYQEKYTDWIFLKHEEISADPERQFEKLFYQLNLNYTENIREKIHKTTGSNNPAYCSKNNASLKLNSRENIKAWKKKLESVHIDLIYNKTHKLAEFWYNEKDW